MLNRFIDLNIPIDSLKVSTLAHILDCGYTWLASSKSINIDGICLPTNENSKKNKKGCHEKKEELNKTLQPIDLNFKELIEESVKSRIFAGSSISVKADPVRIFTRINIKFSSIKEIGHFFNIYDSYLNNYDIICLSPCTLEALSYCIDSAPRLDLISLENLNSADCRLSARDFRVMSQKGLYFELCTGPMFRNSSDAVLTRTKFPAIIAQLASRTQTCITKHLLFSSGVENIWEIKRPIGLISIMKSLGLKPLDKILDCFTKNPYASLYHGLSRRHSVMGASLLLKNLECELVTSAKIILESSNTEESSITCTKRKIRPDDEENSDFKKKCL